MKKVILSLAFVASILSSCRKDETAIEPVTENYPNQITSMQAGLNPEGIEYNKNTKRFYLSSMNGGKIVAVDYNGTTTNFTSGEPYPLSSAGLQVDYVNNRLLVACSNLQELFDNDSTTKGISVLRVFDLATGVFQREVNLSSLVPLATQYFANDLAIDNSGNVYVTDFGAWVIYKIDINNTPTIFFNDQTILKQPNGIEFHPDGYLLTSQLDYPAFAQFALVKIPISNPNAASTVSVNTNLFKGFDGMVLNKANNVVGMTNNGTSQNTVIELKSTDSWQSCSLVTSTQVKSSTTIAYLPNDIYYTINNDFQNSSATNWVIERIKF